jgi:MtrB/PioB family decaheme-associated outer membrane protein
MQMRNRIILSAAIVLVSAGIAIAQTPPPQAKPPAQPTPAAPAEPPLPSLGSIDFGARITGTDGDEARYERYRDLRDGVSSLFRIGKETDTYFVDASASNAGYHDQRYKLNYQRHRLNFDFQFDAIPLNYSYLTVSPWRVGDDGVLTIDQNLRQQVQNRTAVGVPCAPGAPPASCSNPTQAGQALANRSIYNTNLSGFEIVSRRDTTSIGLVYEATRNVDVNFSFASAAKSGHMPWGASFSFNNANELPLPLDNRTNDITAGVAWANQKGMFRLGWDGSFFNNQIQTLTWDNPIRATDFNNGLLPPNGPYDPSGYSNGNGPARGHMSLPPSNSMNVVSIMGLYKMARRTSVNGTLQFTSQSQDEALIPWTTNPVITTPTVYAAFPNLAALPRSTAEAEVKGLNALLNLNSRPFRHVSFNVRYRYNDRDVQTPSFDATEYVRFDAVPEETGSPTHQFDSTRQTFDASATYSMNRFGAIRAGYSHDQWERHGRGFSDVDDNIFRVSYDAYANQYFTIRAAYESAWRRGDGFVESGVDYEGVGGTQEGLRYYDEADRDRRRTSLTLTVTPMETFDVNVTYAGGRDEFLTDEFTEPTRGRFGLLDADTKAITFGVNYFPREEVAVGATYGYETFSSLQESRNAAPPPSAEWLDPTRNWTLDNDEKVNTFTLYADLLKAVRNTDIRFSYDYMDSNNDFVHGGPRIQQLNTNTPVTGSACSAGVTDCFIPLPEVTTTWSRLAADVKYFITRTVGVGFAYWYEKLDVRDFATIDANGSVAFTTPTGTPRVDYLGGLITGYGARDYNGSTASIRLLYIF